MYFNTIAKYLTIKYGTVIISFYGSLSILAIKRKHLQEKNKPFVDPGLIISQSDSDMRVPLNLVNSEGFDLFP